MIQVLGLGGYALLAGIVVAYATGSLPIGEFGFGMIVGAVAVAVLALQVSIWRSKRQSAAGR